MQDLMKTLELYFGKKAPQIPKRGKEWLVKLMPYLVIIGLVSLAISILNYMSVSSTIFGRYLYGYRHYSGLSGLIHIAGAVLFVIALPGLFKKNEVGWNYLFYGSVVTSLASLNLVSIVISLLIGLYIVFQIKDSYVKGNAVEEINKEASLDKEPQVAEDDISEPNEEKVPENSEVSTEEKSEE